MWGDGLLDKTIGKDKIVSVDLDLPCDDAQRELFTFGTGKLPETVAVNGNTLAFPTLDLHACGKKMYAEDEEYSVHRTYHCAVSPVEWTVGCPC
ncbi:MAG: hypothetical protein KAU31_03635 [Spirochaetaceae bacterium]|nr:hypothetical protein [Spirochaetaceae bacterium]